MPQFARLGVAALLVLPVSPLIVCSSSYAQQTPPAGSNTATAFLATVALKYPSLALLQTITINADAKWVVGGQKETGTAILKAQSDGSSTLQLNLDTATRNESRSALTALRACQWVDSKGTHQLNDVDCNQPVPWFAPAFAIQPISGLLQLLGITDDGEVTRPSGPLRQVTYTTPLVSTSQKMTDYLSAGTRTSVLFDPQTLLPASVEYVQHADSDLNTTFPVRVVYSNYQSTSGVSVPYQIDKYVNGALQLSLTVTTVSIQ